MVTMHFIIDNELVYFKITVAFVYCYLWFTVGATNYLLWILITAPTI